MRNYQDIKLVIFDLDGTLADTIYVYHDGWRKELAKYNVNITQETLNSMIGQTSEHNNKILMDLANCSKEEVQDIMVKRDEYFYDQLRAENVKPKAGAISLLKSLKGSEIPVAVATSSPQKRAEEIIDTLGFTPYISYAIYGEQVKKGKPDPEIYLRVLDHFSMQAEQSIVVEDSFAGLLAGTQAKISTFLVPEIPLTSYQLSQIDNEYLEGSFENLYDVKEKIYSKH
ncbi:MULTISPECIES: HAD family hydrolase [Aerococcus]|uniref:HAD family hydrolase n=1 Tax=Aerococcus TaxID=1375 RepID=UPI000DCB9404|nr:MULTISPECIES: HAD family phosphatase [Aerococcus]KAA9297501.1 HAD family phosphatase [Aerococcus tenax]MDK6688164.1 HAD family phosphatase [Aerococcus urinae]MDK8132716.1 HAD family phosphatase [Aerococcus urinae]MDK8484363.1 HAD family phosphatase [Aerococcus urinae]MDL5179354.1 HAD family phosphatase [Aerococcus tenax]